MSYSQHGEDLRIRELLKEDAPRWGVDVGANDGQSWSNSYAFGLLGYKLLLIEPMPVYAERCRQLYAGNSNVIVEEVAICSQPGEQTFYINDDFDRDQLAMRSSLSRDSVPSNMISKITVRAAPLSDLLRDHQWPNRYAFLSVDAEGFDLDVLKTAALDQYRPTVICVEEGDGHNAVADFLAGHDFAFVSTHGPNGIYTDQRV